MRLFVSEFICGGGCSGGERPASLVREGAAMLRALLGDLLRIPSLQVVTTWDERLSLMLPGESRRCPSPEGGYVGPDARVLANAATVKGIFEVVSVSGPEEEREVFARLCREADATYVIAPELDDELSRRVAVAFCSAKERSFAEQKTTLRSFNCSVEAIDLCGDKWTLYEHFTRWGIPTIPTARVGHECSSLPWPRVLKLRMGAGSQAMQLVTSTSEWDAAIGRYDSRNRCTEAIVQPLIRGRSLSVGAIIDRMGEVHLLPVADQFIAPEREFAYLGGRIPATGETGALDECIRQMAVPFRPPLPRDRSQSMGGHVTGERDGMRGPRRSFRPPHPGPLPHSGVHSESSAECGGEGAERNEYHHLANAPALDSLIRKTLSTIPGLFGYVGVDVLIPEISWDRLPACHSLNQTRQAGSQSHDHRETPLIVEINPRLTTSYVGYQKLCLDNLAALWIGEEPSPQSLRWRPGCVEFNSAGEFR